MAYLDPDGKSVGVITDALHGSTGIASYPAAAAPANGVSMAEVLRAAYDRLEPKVLTGTTDIDDSVQTETTPWVILTITPATGAPLIDVEIVIDLAKATTGYAAVESTATIQLELAPGSLQRGGAIGHERGQPMSAPGRRQRRRDRGTARLRGHERRRDGRHGTALRHPLQGHDGADSHGGGGVSRSGAPRRPTGDGR
jgi:hypothetical protein